MGFKLFLDADGKPQFDDKGAPLFMQDGGSEPTAINVDALYDQIRAVGGEAATHRKDKEALGAALKAFEGLDPEEARQALETVRTFDQSKFLAVDKVEEIKKQAVQEFQHKADNLGKALEEAKSSGAKALEEKDRVIHGLLVENAFSNSPFLREKTVLPPDIAYSSFGKHFAVEYQDGKPVVIAKDGNGNPLFSSANPSAYASPEEAIKLLVETHAQRDTLLRAPNPNGGSGAVSGGRAYAGTPKSLADCRTDAEKTAYLKNRAGAV